MSSATDARVLKQETVSSIIEQLTLSNFHYYVVLAAGFGYMFDSFDTYLVAYAMPAVIRDWHISPMMTGMLTSAGMWGTFLAQSCGVRLPINGGASLPLRQRY